MNAGPILEKVITALSVARLEAIIIGNAAAALNGAPITTLDIDFFIRDCLKDLPKLQAVAKQLNAVLIKPDGIITNVYQIINEEEDIYLDFIDSPSGMTSFASTRSRSSLLRLGDKKIYIASLADVINSKRVANRPKDLAVIPVLEKTREEKMRLNSEKST